MTKSVSSQNKRILDALRTVIDLPKSVTSLDLSIRMGDAPRVNVSFIGMPPKDESKPREPNKDGIALVYDRKLTDEERSRIASYFGVPEERKSNNIKITGLDGDKMFSAYDFFKALADALSGRKDK